MNKNQKVFMWYKVNELWKQGLNKSQISRELEIDRGTVRKYLAMDERIHPTKPMFPAISMTVIFASKNHEMQKVLKPKHA